MMRRLVAAILVAVLGYYAFALFGAWQLRQAVLARDPANLEARVDWPELRARLKPRLKAAVADETQKYGAAGQIIGKALQGAVADRAIDVLVTPAWVARALRGRELVPGGVMRPAQGDADDDADPMPPRRLRWAFFESPSRFRIEAVHPRLPGARIVAILGLVGVDWKLVDLDVVKL